MRSQHATPLRNAYDAAARFWRDRPHEIYVALSRGVVGNIPPLGPLVLDVGAGTGAACAAVETAGGTAVACDASHAMIASRRAGTFGVAGDAAALPFGDGRFDAAVAAFVLSHLDDPAGALAEMGRVTRTQGVVAAWVFAGGAEHPAVASTASVVARYGYIEPPWYASYKRDLEPQTREPETMRAVAKRAGLASIDVGVHRIDTGIRAPETIVGWRLGMAPYASFLASLDDDVRTRMVDEACAAAAAFDEPIVREVLVLRARAPRA